MNLISKAEAWEFHGGYYPTREAAVQAARKAVLDKYLTVRIPYSPVSPSVYSAVVNFLANYDKIMKELQAIN